MIHLEIFRFLSGEFDLLTFDCFVEFLLGRLLNLPDLLKKTFSFLTSGDGADDVVVKILFKGFH